MTVEKRPKTLFLDIGGVLLTNGWDHRMRKKGADHFKLDYEEMNGRHQIAFDAYETGKISLDDYLNLIIFYQPRPFSKEEFKSFMLEQSSALPNMIPLMLEMKQRYDLKVVALSNEGKELMEHRIQRFHLKQLFDFFICSGFVHLRKPDPAIYELALNTAFVRPDEVIYIDDREILTWVGRKMGMHVIHHTQFHLTEKTLQQFMA